MRNSIQIQAKKWSHTLGLVVIIYATIGTILSVKFQVNLMAYTTPIIVGFCGMTVVFACTKRFLYKMLLQDGNILFFDKQKNDTPMVFGVYEPQNEPQCEPQCEPQNNENDTQDYEEGRQKGENVDRKGGQKTLKGGQETAKSGQETLKGGQEIQNDTQNDSQNDTQKAKNDTQEVKNDTQGSEIDTQEAKDDTKNSENDTKNDTKSSIYVNDTQEDMNNTNNIHDTKNDTKKETGYSYLDKYAALQREVEEQNTRRKVLIMEAVREYVTYTVAPFLKKEEVLILLENINYMAIGQTNLYKAIRSDANNPLRSPDLRHLAWNIGERLGISNRERAIFIKASFPFELRDATVEYLEKNLRDVIPARIPIDKPSKGDYKFNTLKQSIAA